MHFMHITLAMNISTSLKGIPNNVPVGLTNTDNIRTSHFDWYEKLQVDNHVYNQTSPLCLVSDTCDISDGIALTNTAADRYEIYRWSLDAIPTKFGTDNCATYHICSQQEWSITMSKPSSDIGVKGIAGSSMAEGIGTIQFTITNDTNTKHKIKLDNVIYLLTEANNLISITQWSSDRKDVCGVISRSKYSIFMWEHDSHRKMIDHSPGYPIQLMHINKQDDAFTMFTSKHTKHSMDNDNLLQPHSIQEELDPAIISTSDEDTDTDKQSVDVPFAKCKMTDTIFMAVNIARAIIDKNQTISIIDKQYTVADGSFRYKTRP